MTQNLFAFSESKQNSLEINPLLKFLSNEFKVFFSAPGGCSPDGKQERLWYQSYGVFEKRHNRGVEDLKKHGFLKAKL